MPIDAAPGQAPSVAGASTGRWFIYYRIDPVELTAVLSVVRRLQQQWCADHPGARAAVLQRSEPDRITLTLMEIYAPAPGQAPQALEPALQALQATATDALAPWLHGPRHLEVFEPCA